MVTPGSPDLPGHIDSLEEGKASVPEELKSLKKNVEESFDETAKVIVNNNADEMRAHLAKLSTTATELQARVSETAQRWKDILGTGPENKELVEKIDKFVKEANVEIAKLASLEGATEAAKLQFAVDRLTGLRIKVEEQEDDTTAAGEGTLLEDIEAKAVQAEVEDFAKEAPKMKKEGMFGMFAGLMEKFKPMMKMFFKLNTQLKKMMMSMNPFGDKEKEEKELAELEAKYEEAYGAEDLLDSFNDYVKDAGGNLIFKKGTTDKKAFGLYKERLAKARETNPELAEDEFIKEAMTEYRAESAAGLDPSKEYQLTMHGFFKGRKPKEIV